MECKEFRDTIPCVTAVRTIQTELPVETELLLSDYQPRVFLVVKATAAVQILQKVVQKGTLTINGFVRCTVYYQSEEEQGLCSCEQKIPFDKRITLGEDEIEDWTASVLAEQEYLNCRPVDAHRLELRGAFLLTAKIALLARRQILTALADSGAEQQFSSLEGCRLVSRCEKQFLLDGELTLKEESVQIVTVTALAKTEEYHCTESGAVVKGSLKAQIIYRRPAEKNVLSAEIELPFRQAVEMEGVDETCNCFCAAEAVGFQVSELQQQEQTHRLSITVNLHLRASRDYSIQVVEGAFSTKAESEENRLSLQYLLPVLPLRSKTENEVQLRLSDPDCQLLAVQATAESARYDEDSASLIGKGRIMAFYHNPLGEIVCGESGFEYQFPLPEDIKADIIGESWVSADVANVMQHGAEMAVTVTVEAEGLLFCIGQKALVDGLKLGEPWPTPPEEIALRIYYPDSGESLFEIARHFHLSPALLSKVNRKPAEPLVKGSRLLIPCGT